MLISTEAMVDSAAQAATATQAVQNVSTVIISHDHPNGQDGSFLAPSLLGDNESGGWAGKEARARVRGKGPRGGPRGTRRKRSDQVS